MGNIDIVVELLSLGCDVNAVTSRGETALHYAVRCGQPHVAALILDATEDINVDATTFNVSLTCTLRLLQFTELRLFLFVVLFILGFSWLLPLQCCMP